MALQKVARKKSNVANASTSSPTPRLALSIPQFCEAHNISAGMFYKMKKKGLTPREMKCGTRTLITFEAAADWRREREAASAPPVKTKRAKAAQREQASA
jgi:hypothetical protein